MSVPSTREPRKIPVSQITRAKCSVILVLMQSDLSPEQEVEAQYTDFPIVGTQTSLACPAQFARLVAKRCHLGTPLRHSEANGRLEFRMD